MDTQREKRSLDQTLNIKVKDQRYSTLTFIFT